MTTKKGARASYDYNRRHRLVISGKASRWNPYSTVDVAIARAKL